jgi:glycosyltransferase involved in cell wall biosynthesis
MPHSIKKILHFHFGKDGGAERFFVNLANAFNEAEIEQKFVIRPNRVWRKEIEALGAIYENHYRRISISTFFLNHRVNQIVRKWKPDAVMAWMPRAARLMKDWPETCKIVRLGDFPRHLDHFRNCDIIVGNIPGIVQRCKDLGWGKETAVISNFAREVGPCPVDRSLFDTPEEAYLIAGAGRFVNRKGFDVLVRCLQILPEAYLWLIGEGKEKSVLKTLAMELGVIDRVRFTGWVDEPIHYIASADAFGMPSRHEPLGNSVLDAWRAKVPVVSTRSEGPSWYMRDGIDGMLVDIDATKDFAERLVAIRDNPLLGTRLAAGGLERLEDWFSREKTVEKYLTQFDRYKGS